MIDGLRSSLFASFTQTIKQLLDYELKISIT